VKDSFSKSCITCEWQDYYKSSSTFPHKAMKRSSSSAITSNRLKMSNRGGIREITCLIILHPTNGWIACRSLNPMNSESLNARDCPLSHLGSSILMDLDLLCRCHSSTKMNRLNWIRWSTTAHTIIFLHLVDTDSRSKTIWLKCKIKCSRSDRDHSIEFKARLHSCILNWGRLFSRCNLSYKNCK